MKSMPTFVVSKTLNSLKTKTNFSHKKNTKVMKKLKALLSVFVCLVLISGTALATGIRSEFKEFTIKAVGDVVEGKNIEATWEISYNNSESPITVEKRKTSDGCEYVAFSKYFEVSYLACSKGFGTKMTRKSWNHVPQQINEAVINIDQLKRQQILTPNKVDDEQALGLIASYLPYLINDGYTHVLN